MMKKVVFIWFGLFLLGCKSVQPKSNEKSKSEIILKLIYDKTNNR